MTKEPARGGGYEIATRRRFLVCNGRPSGQALGTHDTALGRAPCWLERLKSQNTP